MSKINDGWNKDRSNIPNKDGFKLEVLLNDETIKKTIVIKDRNGIHKLCDTPISTVKAWRKRA